MLFLGVSGQNMYVYWYGLDGKTSSNSANTKRIVAHLYFPGGLESSTITTATPLSDGDVIAELDGQSAAPA